MMPRRAAPEPRPPLTRGAVARAAVAVAHADAAAAARAGLAQHGRRPEGHRPLVVVAAAPAAHGAQAAATVGQRCSGGAPAPCAAVRRAVARFAARAAAVVPVVLGCWRRGVGAAFIATVGQQRAPRRAA
jgi:hypothetical protein